MIAACATNLLAMDETHPNVLNDLQLQNEIHLQ